MPDRPLHTPVMHVFNDPDDDSRPVPWRRPTEPAAHHGQRLADRTLVWPVGLGHGAVDDDHPRGLGRISGGERTPHEKRDAHHVKIVSQDGSILGPHPPLGLVEYVDLFAWRRSGVAGDGDDTRGARVAERKNLDPGRRFHAREGLHTLKHPRKERISPRAQRCESLQCHWWV